MGPTKRRTFPWHGKTVDSSPISSKQVPIVFILRMHSLTATLQKTFVNPLRRDGTRIASPNPTHTVRSLVPARMGSRDGVQGYGILQPLFAHRRRIRFNGGSSFAPVLARSGSFAGGVHHQLRAA